MQLQLTWCARICSLKRVELSSAMMFTQCALCGFNYSICFYSDSFFFLRPLAFFLSYLCVICEVPLITLSGVGISSTQNTSKISQLSVKSVPLAHKNSHMH